MNCKYAVAILKYEVSISGVSIICVLNRTVGIDVSYSKFFFQGYFLKVDFI